MKPTHNAVLTTVNATLAAPITFSLVSGKSPFIEKGDTVLIADGAKPTVGQFVEYIHNAESVRSAASSRSAWAFFQAGKLEDGDKVQNEIVAALKSGEKLAGSKTEYSRAPMSQTAVNNITSVARKLCPLLAEGEIKVSLSVLKDASAGLVFNEVDGKKVLAPMSEQKEFGRMALPLLTAGKMTQAKIREVRKGLSIANGGTKKDEVAPPAAKSDADKEAESYASFRIHLNAVQAFVKSAKMTQWEEATVNVVTDIARTMGLQCGVVNQKPATAK